MQSNTAEEIVAISGTKITKLGPINYPKWSFLIQQVLVRDQLWGPIGDYLDELTKVEEQVLVEGTEPKIAKSVATTVKAFSKDQRKIDIRALATITLTITDNYLPHVQNCKNSIEAWVNLKEFFQKNSVMNTV